MRIHAAIATLGVAVFAGLGYAAEPVTLSLRWLDKQTYVANVSIDGQTTLLQVGTFNSDTWVACHRFGDRSCDVGRSIGSIAVENDVVYVSYLNSKTLKVTDADGVKAVEYANGASMYRGENNPTAGSRLPLVGSDTQGVLGLGPYNGLTCSALSSSCGNISLYLSPSSDDAGSFVKLGGDTSGGFDASVLASRGITARYSLPVRVSDVTGWQNKRWYLSLVGTRFGDDKALYPRDNSKGDAKALVSLNHATLVMPQALHMRLAKAYLSACSLRNTYPRGWFYECDVAVMNSLPRLNLYVGDKVFYLDPQDYTYVDVSTTFLGSSLVVLLSWGGDWVLGAPFLRKFPTIFSHDADTIDLFCTVGLTCRVRSEALDQAVVDSFGVIQDSNGSSSGGLGSRTIYGPATSTPPSYGYAGEPDSTLWIMWIAKSMGFLMVFILVVRSVRRCRGRRNAAAGGLATQQNDRNGDTGTVASERDLEEAKEDLRRMLAEEEAVATAMAASRSDADFVALQSPGAPVPRTPRLQV